jgi:hypothetical protein
MFINTSFTHDVSQDSVITAISGLFSEIVAETSSNLLTIDLVLLKKILGKECFIEAGFILLTE